LVSSHAPMREGEKFEPPYVGCYEVGIDRRYPGLRASRAAGWVASVACARAGFPRRRECPFPRNPFPVAADVRRL